MTNLPRFIQAQDGDYINIAHITVIGWNTSEHGEACVIASVTPQRTFALGTYDNDADARTALGMIIGQIAGDQQFLCAPRRDFRTAEVGE